MPIAERHHYTAEQRYDDFDELTEVAQQWNLDFRQLDRGEFRGDLLQFGLHDVHVSEARFSRALIQRGTPPLGLRTIVVPADPKVRFRWRGQQVTGADLAIFPRDAELSSTSAAGFHVYTCSFPEPWLATLSDALGLPELDQLRGGASVLRCGETAIQSMRQFLRGLCDRVRSDAVVGGGEELTQLATYRLPQRLLSLIATSEAVCTHETTRKRELALMRAEQFIEQFARENITISDVCRVAEVSQRTLEYAFVERFGVTPRAFLITHRLNGARRELRAADPAEDSVTEIANGWGFWHMGQFAADYRKRFDELPAQTLRRVPRDAC